MKRWRRCFSWVTILAPYSGKHMALPSWPWVLKLPLKTQKIIQVWNCYYLNVYRESESTWAEAEKFLPIAKNRIKVKRELFNTLQTQWSSHRVEWITDQIYYIFLSFHQIHQRQLIDHHHSVKILLQTIYHFFWCYLAYERALIKILYRRTFIICVA